MLNRRTFLAASAAGLAMPGIARAQETPGVTATEIRIGNTMPYSGPASAYGVIGRSHEAFFRMVNDQGGIAGRRINFITYDDGYSPPKTVEQTRRLVEQDRVAFTFNQLGTAANSAILRYMNQRKVPHIFLSTGADKWGNYQDTPWTIGWQPSYRTEAQIYMKHLLAERPNPRIGLLYQNDDFGKDYVTGVRDILGARYDQMVRAVSHEATDPTIDSQVVSLQQGGCDVMLTATTPKFAAQAIRRVFDVGWRPAFYYLTNVSISVGTVMEPAGPEKGVGIITSAYLKDPTDPGWDNDAGMREWRAFMAKHIPNGDQKDGSYPFAYGIAQTLMQVLKQCEGNFSRESIMKQAASIRDFIPATLIPGIKVSTSPTNFHPIRQMQLQRWTGQTWQRFGGVIEGANV
ncbi:ABC transporter substrate-binding protein [Paracraurococcus ruber]|uniref:Branched-chain amino acid ABC transporter substrate-binding protein n=1 Tax=Paracraurococcus ruber TaxID=77675 RepID=A0ABS1D0F7_9PROT|nr:ABC transporter substrate-binding protein [Paracraurococcus ruber]MBK1659961.1 branched-chain amino acid ABC transporter substrate-binding protein [Paracraurococcus ruber]TDG28752.1 branched-chain amino acid ABC transporter substrate-binding protein [Paracraurococcus ruber]